MKMVEKDEELDELMEINEYWNEVAKVLQEETKTPPIKSTSKIVNKSFDKNSIFVNYFYYLFKNYYKFKSRYLLGIGEKIINSNVLEQNFINLFKLINMAEDLINSDTKINYKINKEIINSDQIKYIIKKIYNEIVNIKSSRGKLIKKKKNNEMRFEIKKVRKKRKTMKEMEPEILLKENG